MLTWVVSTLARHLAMPNLVHGFRVTVRLTAVAALKSVSACLSAPTLGASSIEVIWVVNLDDLLGVTWAA